MMNNRLLLSLLCIAFPYGCHSPIATIKQACIPVDRLAAINPDYSGIILPATIAPLNFIVKEPGSGFAAEISSKRGDPITIVNKKPSLRIPENQWKKLLELNRGEPLRITLYVREKTGRWLGFKPIHDTIASQSIDRYVTYRTLSFLYNVSRDLRVYERDLGTFTETPLINSNNFAWGCANCHTPKNNDPRTFVVQTRSGNFGSSMLLSNNGAISKIGSKLGYPAWHPDGRLVAFAAYKVQQCFHGAAKNFIDVYDNTSDIVIYDVEKGKAYAVPELFQKQTLETWPNWSPDGRHLYFCSAPILWTDFDKAPPDNFDKVKYSLMRIAYNAADDTWGTVDTVLSSAQTGLSISQPRISPDGRFLLFCMHEYGGYPHTQKSSDLYLMDIATGKYRKLGINSDDSESWHGWSTDGRWILFSSKRNGGFFTRIYFSYVDSNGNAHKPFIMPQQNPCFYDSFIKSYNYPEFATGPVPFSEKKLLKTIRSPSKIEVPLPATPETPKVKARNDKPDKNE